MIRGDTRVNMDHVVGWRSTGVASGDTGVASGGEYAGDTGVASGDTGVASAW